MTNKDVNPSTVASQDEANAESTTMENNAIWFCPSRWLLAHHDSQANISTMSSHLCLADLNNDGENLLALVDFKQNQTNSQTPYQCRLRVYRGKHLIYNHFLDDLPSCMVVTSNRMPIVTTHGGNTSAVKSSSRQHTSRVIDRLLLTLPINDDIYFYHQLKPQHRIALEDDERILETLNKSELDAWQMVKQNKVHVETMRELLTSLGDAHGSQELTSHSNNFLALTSSDERKNYLLLWKFKKLSNGVGEHIMSMDTICCAAARLRYDSTKLSDSTGLGGSLGRWNKLLDIQKDGIVLGTEDRHLLVYELGYSRAHLEANYRLPSTADHILVERRSPANFNPKSNLQELTYKILISCRNCRIYSIDQHYLPDRKHGPSSPALREIIALGSNVIDMCWTAEDDLAPSLSTSNGDLCSSPNFIVACLDRRVYCFSSRTGQNKWIAELELPITCLISLPIPRINQEESCLVGVASQTNRIDFYISSSGRIVDSIYLSDDYCQAMTFGRFGREDNCLCLTTSKGSLLILILKRTAKFANAQCLSSAASYASHVVTASCFHQATRDGGCGQPTTPAEPGGKKLAQVKEPPELLKPFAISKSTIVNPTDRALDQLQFNHNCQRVVAKDALDSHLVVPKLRIPIKNRDFVDQIVHQARHATDVSQSFARDMLKLKDKVKLAGEHQGQINSPKDANRVSMTNVIGLGNVYRISLSLSLDISNCSYSDRESDLIQLSPDGMNDRTMITQVILLVASQQRRCMIKPFKFDLELEEKSKSGASRQEHGGQECKKSLLETAIDFKLIILDSGESAKTDLIVQEDESTITIDVHVLPPKLRGSSISNWQEGSSLRPVLVSSINIPTCQ